MCQKAKKGTQPCLIEDEEALEAAMQVEASNTVAAVVKSHGSERYGKAGQ